MSRGIGESIMGSNNNTPRLLRRDLSATWRIMQSLN